MRRLVAVVVAGALAAGLSAVPLACTASDPSAPAPDTDGDGLSDRVETEVYGTSPVLKDTDGDGFGDYEEIVEHAFDPANDPYRFNPRVADIPRIEVQFTSPPLVVVHLTDANGVVQSFQTSRSDAWTQTVTNGQSETDLQSQTLSATHTIGSGVSVAFSVPGSSASQPDAGRGRGRGEGPDAGADAEADAAAEGGAEEDAEVEAGGGAAPSATVTQSNTTSDSVTPSETASVAVTFSNTDALGYGTTLAQAETWQQSRTITATTGEMKIGTVLVNRGRLAVKVISLELQAVALGPGVEWPIGNLTPDPPAFSGYIPFALGPGQESPMDFHRPLLSLDEVAAIARDSAAVQVRLSAFELDNAKGVPFVFALDEVAAKDALILIDYGGKRPPEQFLVATNLDPARPGVSVAKALTDILRLPYEASSSELLRVRDVGPPATSAGTWQLEHDRNDGAQLSTTSYSPSIAPYDLGQILLRSGDVLHIAYIGP